MPWIRIKKLTVMFTLVIILLLVTSLKMVQYHSREKNLLHQLQKRREHLSEIWTQCFHATLDHKENIFENSQNEKELHHTIEKTIHCKVGFVAQKRQCVPCPQGTFALEQWVICTPLLSCTEMYVDVQIGNIMYTVGNWIFYAARWNNYDIIYAMLESHDDSKLIDSDTIQRLMPHDNLLYLIGRCDQEENIKLLFARNNEMLGHPDKLYLILQHKPDCDNDMVRFRLAMDYVRILARLHSNKTETLVLCNSHSQSLLLSQFLITEDLRLIIGAFDNLPVLNKGIEGLEAKVKCSRREIKGDFVAPEQKWPYQSSKVFNHAQQPGYTEKSDIWKIPDVTQALLNKGSGYQNILDLLEVVHRKCKSLEPLSRPTAAQVLQEYQFAWKTLMVGK